MFIFFPCGLFFLVYIMKWSKFFVCILYVHCRKRKKPSNEHLQSTFYKWLIFMIHADVCSCPCKVSFCSVWFSLSLRLHLETSLHSHVLSLGLNRNELASWIECAVHTINYHIKMNETKHLRCIIHFLHLKNLISFTTYKKNACVSLFTSFKITNVLCSLFVLMLTDEIKLPKQSKNNAYKSCFTMIDNNWYGAMYRLTKSDQQTSMATSSRVNISNRKNCLTRERQLCIHRNGLTFGLYWDSRKKVLNYQNAKSVLIHQNKQ